MYLPGFQSCLPSPNGTADNPERDLGVHERARPQTMNMRILFETKSPVGAAMENPNVNGARAVMKWMSRITATWPPA